MEKESIVRALVLGLRTEVTIEMELSVPDRSEIGIARLSVSPTNIPTISTILAHKGSHAYLQDIH